MKAKYIQVMVLVDKYNLLNDKGWGSMTNHGDGCQGLKTDLSDVLMAGIRPFAEVAPLHSRCSYAKRGPPHLYPAITGEAPVHYH